MRKEDGENPSRYPDCRSVYQRQGREDRQCREVTYQKSLQSYGMKLRPCPHADGKESVGILELMTEMGAGGIGAKHKDMRREQLTKLRNRILSRSEARTRSGADRMVRQRVRVKGTDGSGGAGGGHLVSELRELLDDCMGPVYRRRDVGMRARTLARRFLTNEIKVGDGSLLQGIRALTPSLGLTS